MFNKLSYFLIFLIQTSIYGSEIIFPETSFDSLPEKSLQLYSEITAAEDSGFSPDNEDDLIDLLNSDSSVTVICPIPLDDAEKRELHSSEIQAQLKLTLETYLSSRRLKFIRADCEIFTLLVFGAEKKEMVDLARFFYQKYMFFSEIKSGVRFNYYIQARSNPEVILREGVSWSENHGFGPVVRLGDGNKFQFILNIDWSH